MNVVQEVNFPPVNGQFPVASLRLIKDLIIYCLVCMSNILNPEDSR